MPYKNPEDKLAWQRANKDKCDAYKEKWAEGEAGKRWLEKQLIHRELQKQLSAERREAKKLLALVKKAKKSRDYRIRQRTKAIHLLGSRCEVCGMDDQDVLEFDHIEPILRRSSGHKNRDVYKEVIRDENRHERFQLLCANCHTKKTRINNEYSYGPPC
jgi:predicted restriction endonuclease